MGSSTVHVMDVTACLIKRSESDKILKCVVVAWIIHT